MSDEKWVREFKALDRPSPAKPLPTERFELLSGVDGGVIVWDKQTKEVIDAYSPDEALRYFSQEQVEAAQANASLAKPLSFHPAHTCSKCGHVTISAKAVEQAAGPTGENNSKAR